MDGISASLIGAGIIAIVSLISIIVNVKITKRTIQHNTMRELGRVSFEIKLQQFERQLNELYGPLIILQGQEKKLAKRLREGKEDPENWRLLDNLESVLADPQEKIIVTEIMRINSKIAEFLISKAGLIRSPGPPESFDLFMGHYDVLKHAMETQERIEVAEFEYYPRKFDIDVKEAYQAIVRERDELLKKYEPLLTQ